MTTSLPTVVLPYYKSRYFEAALESLATQTRKGFEVFIGDDASPEDPLPILEKFRGRLNIRYHRFAENLGRTSLVSHWNRCVRATNAEWVWLFSDDDLAAPDCVESFIGTLEESKSAFDVFRWNTVVINGEGAQKYRPAAHPEVESGAEFALAKIMGERSSFAVEYVFRRSAFEQTGGFVDFPLAWCSDDASWIAFSRRGGLRTMEKGEIFWRDSGFNLSSPNPKLLGAKLDAVRQYLIWLGREFPDPVFLEKLKTGLSRWFPSQVRFWGRKPPLMDGLKFWVFFARFTGGMNLNLLRIFLGLYSAHPRWRHLKAVPIYLRTRFGHRKSA